MQKPRSPILVSACLVGLCTRYDCQTKNYPEVQQKLKHCHWIPVCPEQLGGLATPREAADICHGDGRDVLAGTAQVLSKTGVDHTTAFVNGAYQVLQIAQKQNVQTAYLKARSPSCAVNGVIGVTAALLQNNNIVVTEF